MGANRRTAQTVGGGAALGTLIGAAAGGGKGAVLVVWSARLQAQPCKYSRKAKRFAFPRSRYFASSLTNRSVCKPVDRAPAGRTLDRSAHFHSYLGFAFVRLLRPMTDREKAIPLWPPAPPYTCLG